MRRTPRSTLLPYRTHVRAKLRECGYTVGVFSSPHLIDLAERISIDGQIISHGDLTDVFRLIASKERLVGTTPPSFFELLTAAALYYFADQAVDIALLETGLGGRLDSTDRKSVV